MHYNNTNSRLKATPSPSPELLRRIEECRRRSFKARTQAEKIALATNAPLLPS